MLLPKRKDWILTFLFLIMSSSSIVFIEPSPYDLFLFLFIFTGCILSFYRFHTTIEVPFLLLLFFLFGNGISLFFIKNEIRALFYFSVTIYLVVSWLAIVGTSYRYKSKMIEIIFKGYVVAACIAVSIGIFSYFIRTPATETFLQFGRVSSLFKDPNVFGPFVIPAAVFTLYKAEASSSLKRIICFFLFFFFLMGILLSFSRAAWGNCILTLSCYFLFIGNISIKKRVVTLFILICLVFPCLIYVMSAPIIGDLLKIRGGMQGYDTERFATQEVAFGTGFSNIIGLGPGQSEENFVISTHSLYARLWTENGIIGFVSFCTFFLLSIAKACKRALRSLPQVRGIYAVIFASLIGVTFNSLFVDTLHWRHLWLLLALAWCMLEEKTDVLKMDYDEKDGECFENCSIHYQDG
ncbi:hypothetical protein U0X36_05255 [Bacillus thuringiensis]|uniref:O-antigen ligase family protein n=1 Tax=Bacillus thuringiensis TaxID=1428 RepID=UPI000E5138ED|nr:hypothetical protein [Bacillus thuringiensis]MDZ3952355.1 hypothetical protein [Bacillus thuringiensis]RGP45189.1 hypothetical protein BTW32_25765 [Bacillus thuringiensis]